MYSFSDYWKTFNIYIKIYHIKKKIIMICNHATSKNNIYFYFNFVLTLTRKHDTHTINSFITYTSILTHTHTVTSKCTVFLG